MNWNHRFAALALAVALPLLPMAASAYEAYTNRSVKLRAGPSPDYPLVGRLRADTPVEVEGCLRDASWCDVSLGYERGWVRATALDGVYSSARAPIGTVALAIGIPVVTFALITYWDRWYRDRPWYSLRPHWTHRPPGWRPPHYPLPPPGFLPPPPRPPGWRPLPPPHLKPLPPYRPPVAGGHRPPRPDWRPDHRPDWKPDRPHRPHRPEAGAGNRPGGQFQPPPRPYPRPEPVLRPRPQPEAGVRPQPRPGQHAGMKPQARPGLSMGAQPTGGAWRGARG